MKSPRYIRRALLTAVALVALIAPLLAASATPATATTLGSAGASAQRATGIVKAADLTQFRAGNIIADPVFFDASTMNAAQIDSFLRGKVSSCQSGYVCLKDYRQPTPNRGADKYCNGYQGSGDESAATILAKVSQSCGINPQVFIVMLQKEQGLVTHTWPSKWRYDMAFGMACPDDAPCDSAYAGFFNQVYGAARQMKIYAENYWFTWFAPGNTWQIQYNPNTGCGRGPVYVENTATASLYYYTPYQPNAAALRAGYGEGDACSAYGNRNFFNYFTDWFGSTQQSQQTALVAGIGRNEVYLVIRGAKHHVPTSLDLRTFEARLGGFRRVAASYIDSLPTGGNATRYVHDPATGTLYLLEPDGSKHRFPTAELIGQYGYAFSGFVDLPADVVKKYVTGAEVSEVFQPEGSGDVYVLDSGARRHVYDLDALGTVFAGRPRYIATMDATRANAIPVAGTLFTPNRLVRQSGTNEVYLTTTSQRLVHIPSFALAAEFGATEYSVARPGELDASPRVASSLSPFVTCDGQSYVLHNRALRPAASTESGGFTPVQLSRADCNRFPSATGSALAAPYFVQGKDLAEVYLIDQGALRHVRTYQRLTALNGNRPLSILSWSAATVQSQTFGPPVLDPGAVIQFSGLPEVYVVEDGKLRHITTYARLLELGGGRLPAIEALSADAKGFFTIGQPLS